MDAEFRVYDYMVAACKSDPRYKKGDTLVFYGKRWRIANAVNRSETQVDESLAKLEDAGWIASPQGERGERKQRRTALGRQTTIEYIVREHAEFAETHDCPPMRYDEETGEAIKPGRMAPAIERQRIRKLVKADLPDEWLDAAADNMAARKGLPPRKEILARKDKK